jgi:hypothetical protein
MDNGGNPSRQLRPTDVLQVQKKEKMISDNARVFVLGLNKDDKGNYQLKENQKQSLKAILQRAASHDGKSGAKRELCSLLVKTEGLLEWAQKENLLTGAQKDKIEQRSKKYTPNSNNVDGRVTEFDDQVEKGVRNPMFTDNSTPKPVTLEQLRGPSFESVEHLSDSSSASKKLLTENNQFSMSMMSRGGVAVLVHLKDTEGKITSSPFVLSTNLEGKLEATGRIGNENHTFDSLAAIAEHFRSLGATQQFSQKELNAAAKGESQKQDPQKAQEEAESALAELDTHLNNEILSLSTMDRGRAHSALKDSPHGTYLLRKSTPDREGCFYLCIKHENHVEQIPCKIDPDGKITVGNGKATEDGASRSFESIEALEKHFIPSKHLTRL